MGLRDVLSSERFKSIERKVTNVLLMLAVFFLGVNAMIWTQKQIEEYAHDFCGIYLRGNIKCYADNKEVSLFNFTYANSTFNSSSFGCGC